MKKTITKYAVTVATVVATTMLATVPAFADGGSAYSPYSPHIPTDTALVGITDLMVVAGVVAYVAGLLILWNTKKMKATLEDLS